MAQLPTSGNWAAQTISTSQSVALTGYVSPNGTITIASGVTLTITVDSSYPSPEHTVMYITDVRSSASRSSIFDIRPGGKLIIRGMANCPIIIEGNGDQWGEAYLHDDGLLYPPTSGLSKAYTAPAVRCDGEIDFQYVTMQGIYNCSVGQATDNLGTIHFGTTDSGYVSNLDHVTFKRNVGFCGSVLHIGTETRGTVNMSNCTATHNEAHHISDNTTTVHNGGSIRTNGSSHMVLNITNSTFDHNKSGGNGGAIYASSYNDGSMITLSGCEFSYNYSGLSGGGILFEGNSSLQGINRFHHNTALRNGGGISIEGYSQQTTGQAQTINFYLNPGLELDNNYSPCGAGLGINLRASVGYGVGSTINITVDGSNIHGNHASTDNAIGDAHLQGGGIYILNNLKSENNYTVNVNLNGCKIKDNVAGMGAGVYVVKANVIGDGTSLEISGNKSNIPSSNLIYTAPENWNCGGGVVVQSGDLNLKNGVVKSNEALVNGGGAAVLGGTLEINGCQVGENGKSNKAVKGGGMFVKGGNFTINSGSIQYNDDATIQNGAGIYVQGGNAYVNGGSVMNNKSQAAGAGIYVEGGNIEVSGGSMASNTAASYGGGFFVNSGSVTFTGGDVQNNKATTGDGGGFYVSSGNVTMSGGTIRNNGVTSGNGGAFFVNGGDVTISDGLVSGNEAVSGGGVYVGGGNFTFNNGTISGNTASSNGGGAYVSSGIVTFKGNLSGNTALNGGGLYLGPGASMEFKGGLIIENHADTTKTTSVTRAKTAYHGGVGIPGWGSSVIEGCGGGIYLQNGPDSDHKTTLTFKLDPTDKTFGLYTNRAQMAGDDIVAEGQYTEVVLPSVREMQLYGFEGKDATPFWYQDYFLNDTGYSLTNGHAVTNEVNYIGRFRQMIQEFTNEYYNHRIPDDAANLTRIKNFYLCLTLSYNMLDITISALNLLGHETALFQLVRHGGTEDYKYDVLLKGDKRDTDGKSSRTLRNMPWGTYSIFPNDAWNWAYDKIPPQLNLRLGETGNYEFVFDMNHLNGAEVPQHYESQPPVRPGE